MQGHRAVQAVMRQQFDAVVAQLTGGGGSPSTGPTREVAHAIATAAPTLQVPMYPTAVGKPTFDIGDNANKVPHISVHRGLGHSQAMLDHMSDGSGSRQAAVRRQPPHQLAADQVSNEIQVKAVV
jgi:hypothetical protein